MSNIIITFIGLPVSQQLTLSRHWFISAEEQKNHQLSSLLTPPGLLLRNITSQFEYSTMTSNNGISFEKYFALI